MKQITAITNFAKLDKVNQKKIYEGLGNFLALACLEQLKVLPIDDSGQAGTLQLNTNEAKYNNSTPPSRKLQTSPNESYRSIQQPTNTHLPINENNKFSKPTEGQNKD